MSLKPYILYGYINRELERFFWRVFDCGRQSEPAGGDFHLSRVNGDPDIKLSRYPQEHIVSILERRRTGGLVGRLQQISMNNLLI